MRIAPTQQALRLIDDFESLGWNRVEAITILEAIRHAAKCPEFAKSAGTMLQEVAGSLAKGT